MGQILPFYRREKAFDLEMTAILAAAYAKALAVIERSDHPRLMRDVAARRIIALAAKGERNPDRLCAAALATITNATAKMPEPTIRILTSAAVSRGSALPPRGADL